MNRQSTRPNLINSPRAVPVLVLIVLAMVAAAVTAIGCAWPGTSHSVRFSGYQTEREMGRLPPLPTMANGLNGARAQWDVENEAYDEEDEEAIDDYSSSEDGSKKLDSLWEHAEEAEKNGNLRLDRDLLSEYLKNGVAQSRRNSANDRLDALSALNHGASSQAISAYLEARRCHDRDDPSSCKVDETLDVAQRDHNLKDNVAYLKAAELYRVGKFAEAATAFRSVADKFSWSEKREVAFFMTAVAMMKTSVTYIGASGNSDYDDPSAKHLTDQAWHDSFAAFQRLISEYPRGKFANEARGWQAYLMLRAHDRARALAQYYRILAEKNEEARIAAAFSLTLVRSSATEDEMSRVETDLADEPQAALAYAYHNIYNYSIDPGPTYPPYEENTEEIRNSNGEIDYTAQMRRDEERVKEWQERRKNVGHKERLRTLEFSKQLMTNYPNLSLGGAFALRAAQASEELGDNEAAVKFAQRALQSRLSEDERRDALWTLGVAQHRLRHFDEARGNLQTLLRDHPNTNLTEGARRILAMIAEDTGDIDAALEQYIALKYDIDEAYFVDYLMRPEQLAVFIEKHPDSPKKNEFTYALGVRYLRINRWEDARKTFAQVKTDTDDDYNYYCSTCNCDPYQTTNCADPKADAFATDADETGRNRIPPQLLLRDMQTANDLEALERAADQAVGDEAKAEALYQYASYQYEASSLLFYNPLASPGYYNLGEFAGLGKYRMPNEAQVLFDAMQEHERLARALKIYLDIARRFPHTRAARDALYTAAVCHERLSNYNPYWRIIYENGLHASERMVTYADVKATYPNYQLPRGTYGWQPSTRTVNDGPGWATAPKPPPRLTKRQRLKLFVSEFKVSVNNLINSVTAFWNGYGKRWLIEIMIVIGLVFTFRMARRNQRQLRKRIARHRIEQAKQVVSYPWFELFWIDPERPKRREQVRRLLQAKRHEFVALARDRRSRPVLWRSIVSFSAVTWLMFSLLWTIWFG